MTLESIAWFGTEGPAGSTLVGLPDNNPGNAATQAAIASNLGAIVSEGFNTVRIPWSDVDLQAALPLFQAIVTQAGKLGLKIIFDHHDDDGHYSQQSNGLWFDSGPGTNGTDGNGDTGTITAAQFQADTVTLARAFSGNATVIGFDLDNEPLQGGTGTTASVNWGGGGPTDIQAMYSTVGSAVEAADPGALVVAEGPQNWSGTLMNGQGGLATEGDLSAAAAKPVVLTVNGQGVANKVVYSVHEYPSTVGAEPVDSGPAFISQMNNAWGYLEAQNIAPVWIGEIGASLDGSLPDSQGAANQANEAAFFATIIPYLNGQDGSQGGPTVKTGFDWWASGNMTGLYNTGPNGGVNAAQAAMVSQLLTYVAKQSQPGSANGTVVTAGGGAAITDGSGNKWTINASGQVAVNGAADTTTANVIELGYVGGAVWQENASKLWWGEPSAGAGWSLGGGTAVSPLPPANTPTLALTDDKGATASVAVIASGTQVLAGGSQTALDGNLSQAIVGGVANISTDTFAKGILSVAMKDTKGGSYGFNNFLSTNVELGGAAQGALTVAGAAGGSVVLDGGNYAVSITAEGDAAGSAAQNQFHVMLGGLGAETLRVDDSGTHGISSNVIQAGSGVDFMSFVGTASTTVQGGAGAASVVCKAGTNSFVAGTGTLLVTGGGGADGYTFHAGDGLLRAYDFSLAKGDTLTVDKALQGAMAEASDGHGGLMISFGVAGHGVDLVGTSSLSASQIHFV